MIAGSAGSTFNGLGRLTLWLAARFPQMCVQSAGFTDEHPLSLDLASARNLRFLDREKDIIYPWTRESKVFGKAD